MKFDSNEFKKELHVLLAKHNVGLGVDIDGDTHGLLYNFVVEDVFSGDTIHILNEGCSSLEASDLKEGKS